METTIQANSEGVCQVELVNTFGNQARSMRVALLMGKRMGKVSGKQMIQPIMKEDSSMT